MVRSRSARDRAVGRSETLRCGARRCSGDGQRVRQAKQNQSRAFHVAMPVWSCSAQDSAANFRSIRASLCYCCCASAAANAGQDIKPRHSGASHACPAPSPHFSPTHRVCLALSRLQRALGWVTILGGCILFTSNMDRLFRLMTNNTKPYAAKLALDKAAAAKSAH